MSKINLCNTCIHTLPYCDGCYVILEFGNGIGNDNIVKCSAHKPVKVNLCKHETVAEITGFSDVNKNYLCIRCSGMITKKDDKFYLKGALIL